MNNCIDCIDIDCGDKTKRNCTVRLDRVSCDGYSPNMTVGAFTHFHEDHIHAIPDCIGAYDVLLVHPITFEAIVALKPGVKHRAQWLPHDFDTMFSLNGMKIRLLKANHIPGSCQVHVETDDKSLLYSGDFNYPDVQIRHADCLVLDATHGDIWYDGRTDRKTVKNRLFEDVKEKIDRNKSVIIKTHTGTLQELVYHFEVEYNSKLPHDVSFIMNEKQKNVLKKIYKYHENEFRDNIIEHDSQEFWNMVRNNKKFVMFTNNNILDEDLRPFYRIIVDQYKFQREDAAIIPHPSTNSCHYNLSSHASIENIYQYISDVNPKYVIADYSRSKYAPKLVKLIEQKFPNIVAEYRPKILSR